MDFTKPSQPIIIRPSKCDGCPYKSRTCGSKGPLDSPFVIVGESPGNREIMLGQPFVGDSGKLVDSILEGAGLPFQPYVTNAVACLPVNKTTANLATACQACHGRLLEDIRAYPRKVILAFGNGALWGLTGNYNYRITNERGKIIPSDLAEQGIVASVHPAFLLRGGGSQRLFKEDILKAVALAKGQNPRSYVEAECIVMETESDIRDLIDMAVKAPLIAADIETSDLKPRRGHILSQGFCFEPERAYIVPPPLFEYLGPIYDPTVVKGKFIWHHGKFDVGWLRHETKREFDGTLKQCIRHQVSERGSRQGYQFAKVDEDTIMLNYSLDENRGIHSLEQVSSDLLGTPDWKAMVNSYLPKAGASYANIPPDVLYRYQAKDLGSTFQIYPILRAKVAKDAMLEKLYTRMLLPASELLTDVESNGFAVDKEQFAKNEILYAGHIVDKSLPKNKRTIVGGSIAAALLAVNTIAMGVLGYPINPGSWQQVQKLLYVGGLDLAKGKVLGTDEKILESLPPHPAVKAILEYRGVRKAYGTYIIGLQEEVETNQRIYATYSLTATTTGRLACRDPNLQNIDRNPEIKGQFVAAPGKILISVDLNQAELRSLACLSNCTALCRIYETPNESIHKIVATKYYGANYNEDEYQLAKAVTFGIVYGREAFSIAQEYKIPVSEAQAYISGWFAQFPGAKAFIDLCRQAPLQGKILRTPFGRKRRFGVVSYEKIHDVQNQAANFPHQSIASDITLDSAIEVNPWLKERNVKIVNIVHDDILMEADDDLDLANEVANKVKTVMAKKPLEWGLDRIPFVADAKIGKRWGYLQKPS